MRSLFVFLYPISLLFRFSDKDGRIFFYSRIFLYFAKKPNVEMHKFTLYLKVTARRLSNPVFFMLLGLSLILWYVTKLSHSYTANINIPSASTASIIRCGVRWKDQDTRSCCTRSLRVKTECSSRPDNIAVTPSTTASGLYDISPFWLQNTISSQITDLKIKSVAAPVEIEFPKRSDD